MPSFPTMQPGRRSGQLVLIACVAALLLAQRASAATINVTSNADDGSPGTLRAAIVAANPGDTISIPAMTITLGGTEP